MRKNLLIPALILLLSACKKSTTPQPEVVTPATLTGKWVRGEFDMSLFATWQGTAIQNAALTTGALEFLPDGTIMMYSVFFPTDAEAGCNPQVLQLYTGTADFMSAGKMICTFTGGTQRIFYQQCPGKTNTSKNYKPSDFNGTLDVYWSVETKDGKTLLYIAYSDPANPRLYFEKKNW